MQEKIWELALNVSSVSDEDEPLLKSLCQSAEEAWTARLRDGISPADCKGAFPCAVAFTAAAHLAAARSNGTVASFSAGSVSVQGRSCAEQCALRDGLRQTAEQLMAPFVSPSAACLRRTPG